ncbi:MAG: hypothetical protein ACREMY_05285 [bacterium]
MNISTKTLNRITVTATLDYAEQWERQKRYAETILYRVEAIDVVSYDNEPDVRVKFKGPRVLKNGSTSSHVHDDSYGNALSDIPSKAIRDEIKAVVAHWRARLEEYV